MRPATGMNAEPYVYFFGAERFGDLVHDMLGLGDGHAVTRDDHDLLGIFQQLRHF